MSNPAPESVRFSTRYKYFLNKDTVEYSFNYPSTSVPIGESRNQTFTVPVDNEDDITQIRVNYSFDSSRWYIFPVKDIAVNSEFSVSLVGSHTSSGLQMTAFIVNLVGGTAVCPAFTININVYVFEPPN